MLVAVGLGRPLKPRFSLCEIPGLSGFGVIGFSILYCFSYRHDELLEHTSPIDMAMEVTSNQNIITQVIVTVPTGSDFFCF